MAISSIPGVGAFPSHAPTVAAPEGTTGGSAFGRLIQDMLANEASSSAEASKAVQSLASGEAENLHSIALSVARADLNFRLLLELRNRFTEAYQEVMRMQV
jgi:flagellar hook-basal body complex protein FliE